MTKNDLKDIDQPGLYLSVVVPIYNEVENVNLLCDSILAVLERLGRSYEVIFIDDGSTDGTTASLRKLAQAHPNVKAIIFRGNFGQSAAMAAGFEFACGEVIISMDGDLQNDPVDIPKLLAKLNEGYDLVAGWRKNRKDRFLGRKVPSVIANRIICSLTNVRLHDTGCSLKAFRRSLLKRITLYGEMHRFIPALTRLEGGQITELVVDHHARQFGKSKYNLTRTFRVIMDLATLRLLVKHLANPQHYFGIIGLGFAVFGSFFFCLCLYFLFIGIDTLAELNVIITLIFLCIVSAVQFGFLGLVGKLIVESGERRRVYAESIIDNQRDEITST